MSIFDSRSERQGIQGRVRDFGVGGSTISGNQNLSFFLQETGVPGDRILLEDGSGHLALEQQI